MNPLKWNIIGAASEDIKCGDACELTYDPAKGSLLRRARPPCNHETFVWIVNHTGQDSFSCRDCGANLHPTKFKEVSLD